MKTLSHYLLYSFTVILFSCSTESVGDALVEEEISEEEAEYTATEPCDFDLSTVEANSTTVINCILDLKGETITLPADVNFDFEGGDITNGKLVFSGGIIDGRLLSSKLEIEGEVKLKDPEFKLTPSRWEIVQGETTSEIALKNNQELERLFLYTKELGATTFKINKLDAYFEVTKVTSTTTNANWYPTLEAVNIPSNFNLVMTEKTHLRIFPGDKYNRKGGAILSVRDAENITVTGGNLHGDRDQRVFSADDNGTEGSHLFYIHSGRNIVVDGVNFEEGSSGTFAIFSFGFSYNSNYNPTQNVTIKNCVIKKSRRMAIALVDGRDIVIENNTFIDSGQPSEKTDGGEVGYAINIEPERFRDENGNLKERQRVFDVLIKGNIERGSRGGFLTLTIGQDITVEDNTIGTRVVYSLVSGIKIINNKFSALGKAIDSWAIFAAGSGETVFNNEVGNNNIEGYSAGIIVGSYDAYVHDNTITNCGAGIQLSKATKARIHNNTINVAKNGIQATNTYNTDIEIKGNNVVTSGNFNVYFAQVNNKDEQQNNTIVFDDNTFENNKAIIFSNTAGVTFSNNTINGGVTLQNVTNIEVSSNVIKPSNSDGIRFNESHSAVSILNNTIYEPTSGSSSHECIDNKSVTPNEIVLTDNTCN